MSAAVLKQQMEFYFSDANLSRDQFTRQLLETNNGSVALEMMNTTYPKLKSFNVTVQQIADALKDSELLQVDASFNVSRKVPYEQKDMTPYTLYVKGLPRGSNIGQVTRIFATQLGVRPQMVDMHRTLKNSAKGSCEVVFATEEEVKKALEYFGNQAEESREKADACLQHFKKQSFQPGETLYDEHAAFLKENLIVIPLAAYKAAKAEEAPEEKKTLIKTYVSGLVLKIANVGTIGYNGTEAIDDFKPTSEQLKDQQVTRLVIQQSLQKYGEIKYIEYTTGAETAYVRFKESSPDAAKNVLLDQDKEPLILGGATTTVTVLQGGDEEQYWGKILAAGDRKWKDKKGGKGRR